MTIQSIAQLDEAMLDDITNGDQEWRNTIRDRFAVYLEDRAASFARKATETEQHFGFNPIVEKFRQMARNYSSQAPAVQSGEQPFDSVEVESLLRAIAISGLLETEPLHQS